MRKLAVMLALTLMACGFEVVEVPGKEPPPEPACSIEPGAYDLKRTVVDNTCGPYHGPITPKWRDQETIADGALEACDGTVTVIDNGCGVTVEATCEDGEMSADYNWVAEDAYSGTVEHTHGGCSILIEVEAKLFPTA